MTTSLPAAPAASLTAPAGPLLPQLSLAAYLVLVAGAGVLGNVAVVASLFRRERNVFHSIILQLAISDLVLLCCAAGLETWTLNEGSWRFGGALCVTYRGCEVLAATASAYLTATLALHALATAGLYASGGKARRPVPREDDSDAEMRSSRHSLVAHSNSSTPPRTMHIDYRIANTAVPVTAPLAVVWVLSVSLSVPQFVLASTVELAGAGVTLCGLADDGHRLRVRALLAACNLLAPALVLAVAGARALCKLRGRRRGERDEVTSALVLSVWLAAVYLLLNVPRLALAVYNDYEAPRGDFRSALLNAGLAAHSVPGLVLSCVSYAASALRPLLCVLVLPDLRRSFSFSARRSARAV